MIDNCAKISSIVLTCTVITPNLCRGWPVALTAHTGGSLVLALRGPCASGIHIHKLVSIPFVEGIMAYGAFQYASKETKEVLEAEMVDVDDLTRPSSTESATIAAAADFVEEEEEEGGSFLG